MPRGQRHAVQQLIQLHALTPFPVLSARFYRPAPLAVLRAVQEAVLQFDKNLTLPILLALVFLPDLLGGNKEKKKTDASGDEKDTSPNT